MKEKEKEEEEEWKVNGKQHCSLVKSAQPRCTVRQIELLCWGKNQNNSN